MSRCIKAYNKAKLLKMVTFHYVLPSDYRNIAKNLINHNFVVNDTVHDSRKVCFHEYCCRFLHLSDFFATISKIAAAARFFVTRRWKCVTSPPIPRNHDFMFFVSRVFEKNLFHVRVPTIRQTARPSFHGNYHNSVVNSFRWQSTVPGYLQILSRAASAWT